LKLEIDELLLNFAFDFSLRRYKLESGGEPSAAQHH